jgi:hypothetical protein
MEGRNYTGNKTVNNSRMRKHPIFTLHSAFGQLE